ncbi:MAG: selenium cofactor biosynthesis protein YqeC [Eubacteriales bacterium]|nr:selenium cofactor biosynthesis protein YqeC [Eubacteriales bacterium]
MTHLLDDFEIDFGDIVSVIGSGGKTSLLYALAREAQAVSMRVLLTTTTHIARPKVEDFRLYTDLAALRTCLETDPTSAVYVFARSAGPDGMKLSALSEDDLELLQSYFDLILIEADGSKRLPLKAWRDHEPVIDRLSTKTCMVLPIDLLEIPYREDLVFHPELFTEAYGVQERFEIETYLDILDPKRRPMQGAVGRLYVYLSRSDRVSAERRDLLLRQLAEGLARRDYPFIKIVSSSGASLETEF